MQPELGLAGFCSSYPQMGHDKAIAMAFLVGIQAGLSGSFDQRE
jgi:hypothetical protein